MRHTHHKPKRKTTIEKPSVYVLSIKLPGQLVDAIDVQAAAQYRTRASLIRETLMKKFQEVA